jgi:hypothetical protein
VINSTGNYTNTIGPINDSVDVTIKDNITLSYRCKPGRYWVEKFTIRNTTLISETANITVFIDVPISASNNADILTTGSGSFNGQLPINSTTYQSFYFNTSLVPSATGIKINLTGWLSTQDVDLFLLDNSSTPILKAKSINTTTTESLLYSYLPQEKMWEIRIYGNSTSNASYSGNIIFTTLNVTNTSYSSQQISSINFGNMNASETKQINITLKNEGNLNLSSVTESKELYISRMFGGSGPKNFTLLIPNSSIVSRIKVSLNWTGGSNYSFKIYNQNDSLLLTSANKRLNANKTGVMQEEYNETTNIGSTANLWKFGVFNSSANDTDSFNLTVYVHVSPSNWITTNYTTMTFNSTDNNNYTVVVNFTVQNNSLDGSYEGYINYLDNNGVGIRIPISLNVRAPMLVVNNSLSSLISTINESYGINHTRSVNFFLNNTGYYNLSLTLTNSFGILTCFSGGCSGYFANLNYNQTTFINNYSSRVLNVNITYNSSMPVGVYEGWILINGSNSPVSLSSHPYETFNLTLRLNLVRELDVRNYGLTSSAGNDNIIGNASAAENITLNFKVYYINGTEIENQNALSASNFTVWLTHKNMSSYRIPTSGSLSLYNGTTPIYTADYNLLATVPANKPGGTYDVHLVANYTKSASAVYGGEGVNQTLVINNSALKLTCVSCPSSLTNGSGSVYNISVKNYGWATAYSEKIRFIKGTRISSVTSPGKSANCPIDDMTNENITLASIGANGTTCYIWWTITASTTSGDGTSIVNGTNAAYFDSYLPVPITVTREEEEETTTTASSSDGDGETTTTIAASTVTLKYLNITSYPSTVSIPQGGNKTENVIVKNINNTLAQQVNLTVQDIDSAWFSVNPSTKVKIENSTNRTYSVNFSIPENATVKDYTGKFSAYSFYDTDTKTFTLRVTPGAKLQSEITLNLSRYQSEFKELEIQLNESKKKGVNNTEAENLFNQLKEKLNQALNYINTSDYKSAYDLCDDIESLLNQTKTALSKGKAIGDFWKWGKWVIVAIVAVVFVIVSLYLFWPTPGFKIEKPHFLQKKEFVPEEKKEKSVLQDKFEKLKEKWKKAQEKKE